MKHDGLIQSDQAEKLYSYPTLSGDSDTFLNGAGDFDHPHVEYFAPDGAQAYRYPGGNYQNDLGGRGYFPTFAVDKYGHVIGMGSIGYKWNMPNAYTAKLDAYPNISSDVSLTFAELELANGNTVSLLAAVPASEG